MSETFPNLFISRNKVVNRRNLTKMHYHDEHELYYLLSGNTKYFIKDEIFSLSKGDFIFIPKNTLHKTDSDECLNNERILISINDSLITPELEPVLEDLSNKKLIGISEYKLAPLEDILFKIEAEYVSNNNHKFIMINTYIIQLMTLLSRYARNPKTKISPTDKLMTDIAAYISKNFSNKISLESLCEEFNVSKSYLSRQFKTSCGIGINEYLTGIRISAAEKLLANKKYSITDIALRCGYNDSNYFAAVFKKYKGVTPLKFSKEIDKNR